MTEHNMAARLAKIMGDVGRVEKKGRITSKGDGPSYKFAKDSDVLEAVTPKMAEEGIVLIPETQELLSMEPTMSGRQMIANIKTGWHVTDGKESLRFETFGQGADSGDKALPKAQSNARKYAFFMLYHIVTGDDPDQHASEQPEQRGGAKPSSPRAAPVQPTRYRRGELQELMAEQGLDNDAVEAFAMVAGIPRDERPMSDGSMDQLIDVIRESVVIEPPAARAGVSDGVPTDPADVVASEAAPPASGAPPPKPGTDAYRLLPSGVERAAAKSHWEAHPEPDEPTLAEQLQVPA